MSWYWLHFFHLILNTKNVMQKTSGDVFLRYLRRVSFSYFLQIMGLAIPFKIFVDYVTMFNPSTVQNLKLSILWHKIGNGWKLLLTVATRLLNLTLKCIDKSRIRQSLFHLLITCLKSAKTLQKWVKVIFKVKQRHQSCKGLSSCISHHQHTLEKEKYLENILKIFKPLSMIKMLLMMFLWI